MSTKITNPVLKQMLAEISTKSSEGRITDLSWKVLEEARKKKVKKEAVNKAQPEEKPEEPAQDEKVPEAPEAPAEKAPSAPEAPKTPDAAPEGASAAAEEPGLPDVPADGGADAEAAKEDAEAAKEELEKAKAEKERAEQEIQQQSYVKLGSNAGTQFLLAKVLDHAFKTNTIDALAGEMVQKLKIQTADDMNAFSEDTAMYRVIPGMAELLSAMKTMATKQPEAPASVEKSGGEETGLREMFNRIHPLYPINANK
jgi:hypothetical protein